MPTNRAWKVLQNRKTAVYYIVLTVRGKEIRKTFRSEPKFQKYKTSYREFMEDPANGIEAMRVEVIYE